MVWHILRVWISFFIPTFYKRIQVKNLDRIKVPGPVILALNHPNAFADPILITHYYFPKRLHYLARGDAFKPGFIAWALVRIGIVPIFRIQDGGKEGLKKNDEAYRKVNQLLKKNAKIIVFAEGLCIQERRLRPLKKGVARMIFGAYEALSNDKLIVIPIGINYSRADKFRSDAFYNVGEAIYVKDYIEAFKQNPAKTNNAILQILDRKMKELISHIDNKEDDQLVEDIETLCKKDWMSAQKLDPNDLSQDLVVLKQIVSKVNAARETRPEELDALKLKTSAYFEKLKKNKLRDWLINPKQNKLVSWPMVLLRYVHLVVLSPVYVIALMGNFLPLILTHRLTLKMIKFKEFYASFALGIGMVVFLANYVIWFICIYYFSDTILNPLLCCVSFMLSAAFALYYHPFYKKTLGMTRILKHKELAGALLQERNSLISFINKF